MNDSDPEKTLTDIKVLYIEDDSANIVLMRDIFSGFLPYTFIYSINGEDGLLKAQQELPALILVDINMQGLGGYEVLEKVKTIPGLAQTPVFAISGDITPEQIAAALAAGFTQYITKPFNVIELIEAIKGCLE